MVWRRNHHQRVLHKGLRLQVHSLGRQAHDHHVHIVLLQVVQQALAIGYIEAHRDRLVTSIEGGEQARGKVIGRARHGDHQLSAAHSLEVLQDVLRFGELLIDRATVGIHLASRLGQKDPLAHLLKENGAQVVLQLLDLHGDGGLREVQLFGRACEAAVPGHRLKDAQLSEGQIQHITINISLW